MKKVLVTGGAGFIGSHLIDSLLADQVEVAVIDNFDPYYDRSIKENNRKEHLLHSGYSLFEADIRDRDEMDALIAQIQPDAIVHLAARAGVRPSLQSPYDYTQVNITGTVNLLDAAVKYGVSKFVFGSSSSVYGLNDQVPFSETDPTLQIASPYGATKAAGEALCHSYSNCFKLPIVALRFFTVYGPRQRPDLAIHSFAKKIRNNEPISLFGDGTTSRDYTYVADIVSGIRGALSFELDSYEVFNLGNDQPTSLMQLVKTLEEAIGKEALIEWKPPQVGDVPRTWANIEKARRLLGYNPETDFKTGIGRFAAWLEEQSKQLV
ncbi:SDR family NAD(P)-dependent oxidoreductase [Paenibacillus chartarius]|uniref:SDR family NAD(P)-dependent oxidoreductase n=1 Tax=Paenibacillus chartarius TaxID=747481 RepID=A0ABV6DLH7_9BACL